MNEQRQNQYLILPEAGQRKDTNLAVEYNETQITDYLSQGYVIVNQTDFNKLIGNAGGEYLIADDGSVYQKPAPSDAELLAAAKPAKIAALKAQRDAAEVEPIAYQGYSFDYDSKARERISAAIIALELQGEGTDIAWTTADNQDVSVTAADLRAIVATVAVRSNALHIAYRKAKAQVEAAGSADEVNAVCME